MAEVKCYVDCVHRIEFSNTCELDEISIDGTTFVATGFMATCEDYEEKQDPDSNDT